MRVPSGPMNGSFEVVFLLNLFAEVLDMFEVLNLYEVPLGDDELFLKAGLSGLRACIESSTKSY